MAPQDFPKQAIVSEIRDDRIVATDVNGERYTFMHGIFGVPSNIRKELKVGDRCQIGWQHSSNYSMPFLEINNTQISKAK